MEINISNLKDGEHKFDFTEKGSEFDIEELDGSKEVKVDVVLYKVVNQFNLDINVSADFIFQCDRCLDNYETHGNNTFSMIYKYEFTGDDNDMDDIKEDNLKYISSGTHSINIKDEVRDYLLLSIPMKKAPEEKDGVCVYCGKNINEILKINEEDSTNPVWDQLKKLKK
jgi:uncharacterized protein